MTITEAIQKVLTQKAKPLTAAEIYSAIVAASLFEFKSKSAAGIVRSQLRRHCEGLHNQSASAKKLFRVVGGDHYELLDSSK